LIISLLWSPEGKHLAVRGYESTGPMQLWVISMSDGVWHKLDFPGQVIDRRQVMDMRWVTLNAP
jgi:hypothetical protein